MSKNLFCLSRQAMTKNINCRRPPPTCCHSTAARIPASSEARTFACTCGLCNTAGEPVT